jgi:hypothetical protein
MKSRPNGGWSEISYDVTKIAFMNHTIEPTQKSTVGKRFIVKPQKFENNF